MMPAEPATITQVEDEEAMAYMVSQLNSWNFDIFKFATITKDHPLVSLSYSILGVSHLDSRAPVSLRIVFAAVDRIQLIF